MVIEDGHRIEHERPRNPVTNHLEFACITELKPRPLRARLLWAVLS